MGQWKYLVPAIILVLVISVLLGWGIFRHAPAKNTAGALEIYVTNSASNSITVYPVDRNGVLSTSPSRTISGDNTGLHAPADVVVENNGQIYVSNPGDKSSPASITQYDAGAKGNATP